MPGMTHPEWRLSLINAIRTAYSEYLKAEDSLARAVKAEAKDRIDLWTRRKKDAGRKLDEAFQQLPECQAGEVDMDAIAFAKSLRQPEQAQPEVPMPSQATFLESDAAEAACVNEGANP